MTHVIETPANTSTIGLDNDLILVPRHKFLYIFSVAATIRFSSYFSRGYTLLQYEFLGIIVIIEMSNAPFILVFLMKHASFAFLNSQQE